MVPRVSLSASRSRWAATDRRRDHHDPDRRVPRCGNLRRGRGDLLWVGPRLGPVRPPPPPSPGQRHPSARGGAGGHRAWPGRADPMLAVPSRPGSGRRCWRSMCRATARSGSRFSTPGRWMPGSRPSGCSPSTWPRGPRPGTPIAGLALVQPGDQPGPAGGKAVVAVAQHCRQGSFFDPDPPRVHRHRQDREDQDAERVGLGDAEPEKQQ
jgi:hypothetical protein